jgi:hypothetical protein
MRRTRLRLPAVLLAACAGTAAAGPATAADVCPLPAFGPGADYRPQIVPAGFTPDVTNPWFPLPPGRVLVYTGTKDGRRALDLVAPSARTKVIEGVTTRVVEDRLYLDGVPAERTSDYYAQDSCGNVWYFGEDTAELDRRGRVTTRQGSWLSGERGAQPGVVMQAQPVLARWFRQEWWRGRAEDQFRAVDLSARVRVPYGAFGGVLRTEESTRLEPGILDAKLYAKGIGELAERSVKGPHEAQRLVDVIG